MFSLKPALTLHLLTELPASLSFLLTPTSQLPGATPDATLILHNLGGLLLATNLMCMVLLLTQHDEKNDRLAAMLCLCLGTYHVWPLRRAGVRMRRMIGEKVVVLGGPRVHFVVHLVCLVVMLGSGVLGLME